MQTIAAHPTDSSCAQPSLRGVQEIHFFEQPTRIVNLPSQVPGVLILPDIAKRMTSTDMGLASTSIQ
jgi:hypothetical protein